MVRPCGELRPQTTGSGGAYEGTRSIACPEIRVRRAPARIRPEVISAKDCERAGVCHDSKGLRHSLMGLGLPIKGRES